MPRAASPLQERRFITSGPLGKNLAALGRNQEAAAALRSGLNCDPEPDVETRLLVQLGSIIPSPEEKEALLRCAIARNGNLTAAAERGFQ